MRTRFLLVVPMLLAAACDSATGPEAPVLSDADLQHIAAELDALTASALASRAPLFAEAPEPEGLRPIATTFTLSVGCPRGGTLDVAASTTGSFEAATASFSLATQATLTHTACAIRGRDGTTVTVEGNPNLVTTATMKFVNGQPSGLQTATQKGAFSFTTSNGLTGSCTIDVTSTFDPATESHTIRGVNCGRTIDLTFSGRRYAGG